MDSFRKNSSISSRRSDISSSMQDLIVKSSARMILYVKVLDKPNDIYTIAYQNNEDILMQNLITEFANFITMDNAYNSLLYLATFNNRGLFELIIQIKKLSLTNKMTYSICEKCCKYDSVNIFAYLFENKLLTEELLRDNDNNLLCLCCKYDACRTFNILTDILRDKNDLLCRDNYLLLYACKRNNISIVKRLFECINYTLSEIQQKNMIILLWIFYLARDEIIEILIEKKYITKQLLTHSSGGRLITIYIKNGNLMILTKLLCIAEYIRFDETSQSYVPYNEKSTKLLFSLGSQLLEHVIKYSKDDILDFILCTFTDIKADLICLNHCYLFNILCLNNDLDMLANIIEHFSIDDSIITRQKMIIYTFVNNCTDVLLYLLDKYQFDQDIIAYDLFYSLDNNEYLASYPQLVVSRASNVDKNDTLNLVVNNDVMTYNNGVIFKRKAILIAADKGYYELIMSVLRILFTDGKINKQANTNEYASIKNILESIILTAIAHNKFEYADNILSLFSEYNLCADRNMINTSIGSLFSGII